VTDDERQPIPRAWREEFDNIKPYKRIARETPAQRSERIRKTNLVRWAKFREEDERKAGPRRPEVSTREC
jgi:hypothetical protein